MDEYCHEESLCIQVTIWVNIILNRIDTRRILPRYKGSRKVYRPYSYCKQKYHQIFLPFWYQKL